MAKFKYLGTTTIIHSYIHEVQSKLNLGNACCDSFQNILTSHLQYKKPEDRNIQYKL